MLLRARTWHAQTRTHTHTHAPGHLRPKLRRLHRHAVAALVHRAHHRAARERQPAVPEREEHGPRGRRPLQAAQRHRRHVARPSRVEILRRLGHAHEPVEHALARLVLRVCIVSNGGCVRARICMRACVRISLWICATHLIRVSSNCHVAAPSNKHACAMRSRDFQTRKVHTGLCTCTCANSTTSTQPTYMHAHTPRMFTRTRLHISTPTHIHATSTHKRTRTHTSTHTYNTQTHIRTRTSHAHITHTHAHTQTQTDIDRHRHTAHTRHAQKQQHSHRQHTERREHKTRHARYEHALDGPK